MNTMQRITLIFVLGMALTQTVMAEDAATDEHSAHHPAPAAATATTTQPTEATTAAGMQSLRERMREMRRTRDPAQHLQLMEEQMKQMETVMKDMDTACPKTAGRKPGGMDGKNDGHGMDKKGPGWGAWACMAGWRCPPAAT
jgi:TolA-binding protein